MDVWLLLLPDFLGKCVKSSAHIPKYRPTCRHLRNCRYQDVVKTRNSQLLQMAKLLLLLSCLKSAISLAGTLCMFAKKRKDGKFILSDDSRTIFTFRTRDRVRTFVWPTTAAQAPIQPGFDISVDSQFDQSFRSQLKHNDLLGLLRRYGSETTKVV